LWSPPCPYSTLFRSEDTVVEEVTRLLDRTWIMPTPAEPEWVMPAPPRIRRVLVPVAVGAALLLTAVGGVIAVNTARTPTDVQPRSEEHTSELQSREN